MTPTASYAGVYDFRVKARQSGGGGKKVARIYWKLVELNSVGSTYSAVTIDTSGVSSLLTGTAGTYNIPIVLSSDYTITANSRIAGVLYVDVSGTGGDPSVQVYVEGNTSTGWYLPGNISYFNETFVPYTGATTAIDLGSQTLTTTGNLTAGNVITAGSVDGRDVSVDGARLDKIKNYYITESSINVECDGYTTVNNSPDGHVILGVVGAKASVVSTVTIFNNSGSAQLVQGKILYNSVQVSTEESVTIADGDFGQLALVGHIPTVINNEKVLEIQIDGAADVFAKTCMVDITTGYQYAAASPVGGISGFSTTLNSITVTGDVTGTLTTDCTFDVVSDGDGCYTDTYTVDTISYNSTTGLTTIVVDEDMSGIVCTDTTGTWTLDG
jgi:hypothetical protein